MKRKPLPSLKVLNETLSYRPATGAFVWKVARRGAKAGEAAGSIGDRGYLMISFKSFKFRAHRLAWLLVTGGHPPEHIDHINGNKLDNRWANLRAATASQNVANSVVGKHNKVGLKGVSRVPSRNKQLWCARLRHNGKIIYLGCFVTPELAHAAYCEAAVNIHGDFANSGERNAR